MRERASQVSESRVPRAAADAPENPNTPWAIESRVASSTNVGTGPGCQVKRPRPAGTRHARHARRSTLARAWRASESSEPSSLRSTRAEPASGAFTAPSLPGSVGASAAPPATQPSSGSSALRLSASKSSASWPRTPRIHPNEPDPVLMRPDCAMRRESTYSRRSARTAPESSPAPASRDGWSDACTAPSGGAALSPEKCPRTVKLRRDGGARRPSQCERSKSRAVTCRSCPP